MTSKSLFQRPDLMPIGEAAEAVAKSFFNTLPLEKPPIDVRHDPKWQAKKVDYLLPLKGGGMEYAEVKSDRHIAFKGNALFETLRIHHTAQTCAYLGWSVVSLSQKIYVWCPPAQRLFVYRTRDLQRGMQEYTQRTRGAMRLAIVETDATRTTINILVPLQYVPHRIYRFAKQWELVKETT